MVFEHAQPERTRLSLVLLVYGAGLLQGIALVTIPAAGNLLKNPAEYALTDEQYGALWIPEIAGAVLASSGAGWLARRFGTRRMFRFGAGACAVAMALLCASDAVQRSAFAYPLLLTTMAAIGLGFTLMTAINTYATVLFARHAEAAVTGLHAAIGLGLALPPPLLRAASALGSWTYLPVTLLLAFALLWASSRRLPPLAPPPPSQDGAPLVNARMRLLGAAAGLYGICEGLLGNWGALFLHEERGLTVAQAGLALTLFWAGVTAGRLGVALAATRMETRRIYLALPCAIGAVFALAPRIEGPTAAWLAFAVAGLGCSALLPLTIGYACRTMPAQADRANGLMFSLSVLGLGLTTFGVGPLRRYLTLATLFRAATVAPLLFLLLGWRVHRDARSHPGPAA